MDPLTQGLTGIIAGQAAARRRTIRQASLAGLIGGILPDADVFLHVPHDPLFNLLIHRHFTHSLIFIPLGGFIAALAAWLLMKRRPGFTRVYLFATLGYGTGGLLDACTSYGTYLYWPFSRSRVAWDAIAIIDPIYTLILAAACFLAFRKRSRGIALFGLILGLCYLGAGFYARDTAARILMDTAGHRGHKVDRIRVMPTLGNLILWRGIYQSGDAFHIDGVRLGIFGVHRVYAGPVIQKFEPRTDVPPQISDAALRDMKRFSHFADGYVFQFKDDPLIIGDLRYSLLPHQAEPLWGLVVAPEKPDKPESSPNPSTKLKYFKRLNLQTLKYFGQMLLGSYP